MFKKLLKYLLITTVVVLIGLPYAAKFGAIHYLESEKNITANIDDLDFNLFTGKFALRGVHLYGKDLGELHLGEFSIDVSMLELVNKNILLESIVFRNFSTNVSELDKAWNVGGIHIPIEAEAPEQVDEVQEQEQSKPLGWGYGVSRILFSNIAIDVSSQYTDSQFVLNKFKVNDALSWFPSTASGLELDLSINGDTFTVDGDATPFVDEPLINTRVRFDNVQLKPFLKSIKDLPFVDVKAEFFSDFQLTVELKKDGLEVVVDGFYGLENIYLKDELSDIKLAQVKLEGKQKITLGEELGVLATASLILDKLNVTSLDGKVTQAAFDTWEIKEIQANSIEDVEIKLSELSNLVLMKTADSKLPPAATLDKFIITDVRYGSTSIELGKVELRHLQADLRLNDEGELVALESLDVKEETPESPGKIEEPIVESSESDPKKEAFGFVIKKIIINSNSNVRFVDHSVVPLFDTKLHELKLNITNVNSINTQQAANIDFTVNIDEYGKFLTKGDIHLFAEKLNANLEVNLEALELVPLSSYAGKFAGMNIKRGTLDLDAKIDIKNDELDVKNTFYMNQLIIESDESEVKDNIFKDMPMPLDLTLDVLRDKNNMIKLDIPVTGNVNNPDFRLQDVYNTAMAKAMKVAARHFLLQAVQPLGLILFAGDLVKKAAAPKFDPLKYELGSAEISKTNKQHIDKIAKLLVERDKLRLTICGFSVGADWDVLVKKAASESEGDATISEKEKAKQLLSLATLRSRLVKQYFIEKHEISAKRLFSCNSKVLKEEKVPKVEMGL